MAEAKKKKRKTIKITASDKPFSKLVRMRASWTCECCGTVYAPGSQGLHCSHLFGRRSAATRLHSLNAVAHCFSCHQKLGANPDIFSEWMRNYRGDAVIDRLKYLHALPIKLSQADQKDIKADLEAQLAVMECGQDFETPATILLAIQEAERSSARIFAAGYQ